MIFTKLLTDWYLLNKRDLPWRNTQDPYKIWLSEIMLQQTRVAQGLPYFIAFTTAFPTVFDLANASEEQVLKLWQGLGYYSRARNLHKTAQYIAFECNGFFPDNYNDLLKLKGVGEYTAAAIASFSYNEQVAVVDGNVFRVLSRYFNIDLDISLQTTKKEFQKLAFSLLPESNSATFNQAIMEFGAMQCVPKNPNCESCVMNKSCGALQMKKVAVLPVKSKKIIVKKRYFNYLVFLDDCSNTLINKRSDKGIWHNLYEFPLIETDKEESFPTILSKIDKVFLDKHPLQSLNVSVNESQIHKLTHQHLYIKFWRITVNGTMENGLDFFSLQKFPFPIVIHNFIQSDFKTI